MADLEVRPSTQPISLDERKVVLIDGKKALCSASHVERFMTLEDLNREIDRLQAEKAVLDAQLADIRAQRDIIKAA